MKVLLLTSTFPKNNKDTVPSFVMDQIIKLKQNYAHMSFIVLVPHINDGLDIENSEHFTQVRYHYFFPNRYEKLAGRGIVPSIKENKLRIFLVPFYFIFQVLNTFSLVIKEKPDIIYAHWFTPQAISAYLAKLFFKIPYVFTTHAQDVIVLKKIPILGKLIAKLVIKNSKAWTNDSFSTEKRLIETIGQKNFNKNKSLVIPMPVDTDSYEDSLSKRIHSLEKFKDGYNIVFIGRFAEIKGVENLINIYQRLSKKHKNLNLILCGEGPLRKKYEQTLKNAQIPNTKYLFTGFISKEQKKSIYEFADLVVIPSIISDSGHKEGLPVVLLESLYFGKLILVSKYCNAEEVVEDSINGFFFDPLDYAESEAKIEEILLLANDSKKKIENRAKKVGENFTNENLSHKYYEHLFKHIEKNKIKR